MSELKESDSSDSDNFIIKQIKPINKRTGMELIRETMMLESAVNSVQSKTNKKRKIIGMLGTELRQKEKTQNLIGTANCFIEKSLKSRKINHKNKTPLSNNGKKIVQGSLDINCEKNKLEGIINSSGNGPTNECEELPVNINIRGLPVHSKTTPHLFDKQKNDGFKFLKRVELSPTFFQERIQSNNLGTTSVISMTNKFLDKPLAEIFVEVCESNCSIRKESKSEFSSDIILNDDVKNKIKFEKSPIDINKFDKNLNFNNHDQEEQYKGSSELLCFLLKKIITDEKKIQMEIEEKNCKKGKVVQKLLSEGECEIFEKFFDLEDNACKLFVRMLIRKNDWHRVSTIAYNDIGEDLEKYFNILEKVNFININIEDEDFETQLNLLKKPEVLKLCKAFNVCYKSHNASKKYVLIKSLIQECKRQKSVLDIMKGKNSNSRLDLLKSQIKKDLGMCVKINKQTFKAFYKIILLFSFAHYFEEEEKRLSSELYMCFKIYKNIIKFPNYKLSPTVVFETRVDFEEYETSLMLLNRFEVAITNKNHDDFVSVVTEVKKEFKNILKNYEYHKRFLSLPSFLQKFSAGTVYARILTKYCQIFKRKTNDSDVVETVKLLLNQNFFLQRKRGDWYEILSKALENLKENNAAAEVIITSLSDPFINEVQRLTLQLRGQGILKKKTFGITNVKLKDMLEGDCILFVDEPASIEIKGKALDGYESGFRCVYIQDTEHGKSYISVEETAVLYYKSHGFPKGYHVEGGIIHMIYFIMFFDIIYGLSPEGAFQSPYQEAPLDFNSSSFYLNRKNEIDKLLANMPTWDDTKVETTIKDVYSRNYNTTCIINWNNEFTPEIFCEVIKCITMPILVLIFQRLINNFRVYRSGFPDLTLWNSDTNEIKFVEVKSPNDRLSPAQRIWLNYLKLIGLSSEVCNVKHSIGKKSAE